MGWGVVQSESNARESQRLFDLINLINLLKVLSNGPRSCTKWIRCKRESKAIWAISRAKCWNKCTRQEEEETRGRKMSPCKSLRRLVCTSVYLYVVFLIIIIIILINFTHSCFFPSSSSLLVFRKLHHCLTVNIGLSVGDIRLFAEEIRPQTSWLLKERRNSSANFTMETNPVSS